MTDTPNPLAALLRDVERYPTFSGRFMYEDAVLAALSRALTLPDDEAGKVLAICQAWIADGRGDDCFWEGWPDQPDCEDLTPNMLMRLLAALAADAERIRELEAERRVDALDLLAAHGQAHEAYEAQLAAEARNAALPAQGVWVKPTDAQVASACLSYRHDFGLLPDGVRESVMFQAREWFHAWQKELAALAAYRGEKP